MTNTIDISKDGVDHIRISTQANTELGRQISLGSYRPFTHPTYGRFNSILGFWLWFASPDRSDVLREVHHGNLVRTSMIGIDTTRGRSEVTEVVRTIFENDNQLRTMLVESQLPLYYYDVIGSGNGTRSNVYILNERQWYVDLLNKIRHEYQQK